MPQRRFDHFAIFAPFYDLIFGLPSLDRLKGYLELPFDGLLLDVGGGTGRSSKGLRDLTGGVVIADPSSAMLHYSRDKGVWAVRAGAERLPFADGSFERILVVDAFHHFCDQEDGAAELWRVLAPGGVLVMEEPNIERLPIKIVAFLEWIALMGSRFYRPAAIENIFESLGADVAVHTDDPLNMWVVVKKAKSLE